MITLLVFRSYLMQPPIPVVTLADSSWEAWVKECTHHVVALQSALSGDGRMYVPSRANLPLLMLVKMLHL